MPTDQELRAAGVSPRVGRYLLEHSRQTMQEQAAALGYAVDTIRRYRHQLIKAGLLQSARVVDHSRDEEIVRSYLHGHGTVAQLCRSYGADKDRIRPKINAALSVAAPPAPQPADPCRDCGRREVWSRGLCQACYKRARRNGTLEQIGEPPKNGHGQPLRRSR